MQLLPHKVVLASMFRDLYSSEGPCCFLITNKMALLVSFPPLSSLCGSKQTKKGQSARHHLSLDQNIRQGSPATRVPTMLCPSQICILPARPTSLVSCFCALADFPRVSLLNAQTLRVHSSIILTPKPVKDITKQNKTKKPYETIYLRIWIQKSSTKEKTESSNI